MIIANLRFFLVSILFFLALPANGTIAVADPPPFQNLTLQEFARQKTRTLQDTYGLHLNWKQKIALNLTRRKVKRHLRKYPEAQCQPLWSYMNQAEQPFIESLSFLSLLMGMGGPILIFVGGTPVGFFFAAAAIVLGILGLKRIKKNPGSYYKFSKALAIGGIVLGSLLAALFLIVIISFGAA